MSRKTTHPISAREEEILGFLGEGTVVRGDLILAGAIRVDGRIEGRITSPSTLIVGPAGSLDSSELRVHTLCVAGEVRGNLCVADRLEIQPGGIVTGQSHRAAQGTRDRGGLVASKARST